MANSSGMKIGEGMLDKGMTTGKKEKEEVIFGSLNDRATNLLKSKDYQDKIRQIKAGKNKFKVMEFYMNGVKMGMPYIG